MPTRMLWPLSVSVIVLLVGTAVGAARAEGDAKRGQYLTKAAGCVGCHREKGKDGIPFAGGRALRTPFGTFYGPNITQDREAGIGRWSEVDFIRAMSLGVRPDGADYYPAFPYPSYTKITDSDLRDMWAYVRTLRPNSRTNHAHDLRFFFGWRFLVGIWKWLFFKPGPFVADTGRSQIIHRGAYLVQALGHCGECHTPRNFLGAPKGRRYLAGGKGPDGKDVPNLTPTRLHKWSDGELKDYLTTGITPEGDITAETMGEVIRNTTSQLTPEDLMALIAYLRSLPLLENESR